MQVGIKKIRETAILPEYGTERSACADLRACFDDPGSVKMLTAHNEDPVTPGLVQFNSKFILVEPQGRALVPTGLIFDIPDGYSLRVHPRSGLSFKLGLTVVCGEGVIDEDYQNELFVPVINHSDRYVEIKDGDRIAQIELVKDERCSFGFIEELSDKNSSRNGGFGHTGTN
jgi:dUTP pyrophosphatase